jgi:3-oxoacyl-[acyl-carrier protein] reductase
MSGILSGRKAIVTGSSQGLGFEIAKKFALEGAGLTLCARNAAALEKAAAELRPLAAPGCKIVTVAADISTEDGARAVVSRAIEEHGGLQILVNNAGIYGPKGGIEDIDWAEWTKTIEINVYGSVLMCRAALPHFKAAKYGKIIQLSGGGATNPMPNISAYAVSKSAIVRFAETLAGEAAGFGIDVNAIAPGALNTRMLGEILDAGPEKVGKSFYEKALKQKESGGVPLECGAGLALFLASAASDGITGKLISAVWDNWDRWPEHLKELSSSDAYTLRRITGRDRGFAWGDK